MARDNAWLEHRLEFIWRRHFPDVNRITPIHISFGRRTYRRLGSITLKPIRVHGQIQEYSIISMSTLLQEAAVPEFVIDQVIAHELVHYVQGFGSHHKRTLRHPHQGGVIVKEFKARGLWELYRVYQAWMKLHWFGFLKDQNF